MIEFLTTNFESNSFFESIFGVSILSAACLIIGIWMILPLRGQRIRAFGFLASAMGVGGFASLLPGFDHWGEASVFWILAAITIVAAIAMISSRVPVYSALWFALSLLGVSGLFLYQGAHFLGIATVVVYAGAIVVTFLFVLMLAQPDGKAWYDRMSWGTGSTLLSAIVGSMMVAVLTMTIIRLPNEDAVVKPVAPSTASVSIISEKEIQPSTQHVAQLGGRLFSYHLLAIEIGGCLLLVALVGAIAIVNHGKQTQENPTEQLSQGQANKGQHP